MAGLSDSLLPGPQSALARWRRASHERRMLELDERILRDIGAPEEMIEAARALRASALGAPAIVRRLDFLR